MLHPRLMSNWWNFIKRSITVKCGFWMSIYCFHSCHSLVLILLSHPSSNSMLVLILLSQAASMLLLISLTHSACLSCAITGWLYDSLDTYFVTRPVLRGSSKLHMIRILNLCTNVGLNIYTMYDCWFWWAKKSSRNSLIVCVLLWSVQKMHWGEKMQLGGGVVVGGDWVGKGDKKCKGGEEEGGWDSLALCGLKAVMGGCTHYILVAA